jgi:hypothetical protein
VPIDEEQSGVAGHVAERGNGAEQDGTVATVEDRKAAGLQ